MQGRYSEGIYGEGRGDDGGLTTNNRRLATKKRATYQLQGLATDREL